MRAHALEKNYTLNEYTLKRLTSEGIEKCDKNFMIHAHAHTHAHIHTCVYIYIYICMCDAGTPGEAEKITCEEDIFRILELPYKKPKDRNL